MPDSRSRVFWKLAGVAIILVIYAYLVGLYPGVFVPAGFLPIFAANLYAGYWGLAIRRRLVVGAYRAQALGVSAAAFYFFVIGLASNAYTPNAQIGGLPVLLNAFVDVGYLGVIMYWIHNTFSVSKRSDPLERDTLGYSRTKYAWLLAVAIPIAVSLVYNPIGLVITVPTSISLPLLILATTPWVIGAAFGGALLFKSASGSKDRVLRDHLRWLASFASVGVANVVLGGLWRATGGNTGPYVASTAVFFVGGQVLAAYCLYRCAKSLAQTTKTL